MKKLALYIVEDKESFQFRYRVENIIEVLGDGSEWEAKWVFKNQVRDEDLAKAKIVIVARQTAKDGIVLGLIRKAQKMGIRVLLDIDDLIFDYRDLRIVFKSVGEKNWLYWTGYFWGIRRIAKRVDGFICTNEFLGQKLKRSFDKPVRVIPNSLNQKQVEVSEKCVKNKKWDGFRIGYFSGSPTHVKDFAMVEGELVRFLRVYDDAKLRVVGHMEFSEEIKKMIESGRVEVLGFVDYLKLQKLMAEVDVNIAPLVVNDFTNCKSELKFFEAGVVETTTIASPTYSFARAIEDGKNGFLARPGEWYDKLEYLYQNPKENRKIALEAKKYALKHYYGKEFLKEVEEVYDYFAK